MKFNKFENVSFSGKANGSFSNWLNGFPTTSNPQNCVRTCSGTCVKDIQWKDDSCTEENYALCQSGNFLLSQLQWKPLNVITLGQR